MTVAEIIKKLEALPDKKMEVYFDCHHCGHALTVAKVHEMVIVHTKDVRAGQ